MLLINLNRTYLIWCLFAGQILSTNGQNTSTGSKYFFGSYSLLKHFIELVVKHSKRFRKAQWKIGKMTLIGTHTLVDTDEHVMFQKQVVCHQHAESPTSYDCCELSKQVKGIKPFIKIFASGFHCKINID